MEQEASIEKPKQRHGCLITWLIILIVVNTFAAIINPWNATAIRSQFPRFPMWGIWLLASMGVLNVISAVALFRWKKWGFFGVALAYVVTSAFNFYAGLGAIFAIAGGLIPVAILFAVLQIGGEKRGWSHLE